MKNLNKFAFPRKAAFQWKAGFIALIAVIIITMVGCPDPGPATHTHTPGAAATCLTPQTCTDCGEVIVGALEHNFTGSWLHDAESHWKACTRSGCEAVSGNGTTVSAKAAHVSDNAQADDCLAPDACNVSCGYVITPAKASHTFSPLLLTTVPTTEAEGESTQTCGDCSYVNKVVVSKNIIIGNVEWMSVNLYENQVLAPRPDMATSFWQWNQTTAHPPTGAPTGGIANWPAINTATEWSSATLSAILPSEGGWRLPTSTEFQALITSGSTWAAANTKGNAVAGRFFGPNHATATMDNMGEAIFIPANGLRREADGGQTSTDTNGSYWASDEHNENAGKSMIFTSTANILMPYGDGKRYGFNLRLVRDVP